jgi:hypothetical protein
MEKKFTNRGFGKIEFNDCYDNKCKIQKSSIATVDAIWFGIENPKVMMLASKLREDLTGWVDFPMPKDVSIHSCMHLTQDQVKELLPILQKFAETGEI